MSKLKLSHEFPGGKTSLALNADGSQAVKHEPGDGMDLELTRSTSDRLTLVDGNGDVIVTPEEVTMDAGPNRFKVTPEQAYCIPGASEAQDIEGFEIGFGIQQPGAGEVIHLGPSDMLSHRTTLTGGTLIRGRSAEQPYLMYARVEQLGAKSPGDLTVHLADTAQIETPHLRVATAINPEYPALDGKVTGQIQLQAMGDNDQGLIREIDRENAAEVAEGQGSYGLETHFGSELNSGQMAVLISPYEVTARFNTHDDIGFGLQAKGGVVEPQTAFEKKEKQTASDGSTHSSLVRVAPNTHGGVVGIVAVSSAHPDTGARFTFKNKSVLQPLSGDGLSVVSVSTAVNEHPEQGIHRTVDIIRDNGDGGLIKTHTEFHNDERVSKFKTTLSREED